MTAARHALLLVLAVLAAPASPGLAQTPAAPTASAAPASVPLGPDILPDVFIKRRVGENPPPPPLPPTGPDDMIVKRLPRLRACFTADTWSPDPTAKFNQAYYEELTGEADYYDRIRTPPPKIVYAYYGEVHNPVGGGAFYKLAPETMPPPPLGPEAFGMYKPKPPRMLQTGYRNCADRTSMEKDVTFARGLAMYDKGEYAQALAAFEQAHARVRNSQMAGEIALMIADMYQHGDGAPRDVPRAIEWMKKAVGAALSRGSGGGFSPGLRAMPRYDQRDPDHYYSIASEAAMKLSVIYLTGDGVAKDDARCREWIETAARFNHVPALKIAGDMAYTGFGGRRDLGLALLYYDAAARAGHIPATYAAGEMYDLGEGGKANRKAALTYYGRATLAGNPEAALALAIAYDTGKGVPADPQKAISLYKIAALGGRPQAQTALGTYFYEGGVVEKDLATARAWFEQAAIRGEADGMVNLAAMLIKGEGGEPDLVKAWAWLNLAKAAGRADAAGGMARLEARMSVADLARAKALIAPQAAG